MTNDHEHRQKRVSEAMPVQAFLGHVDYSRLDRLTGLLEATKSEVIRRALAALEAQLLRPEAHPALRLVGLVDDDGLERGMDTARDHDRVLAAASVPPRTSRTRRRGKS